MYMAFEPVKELVPQVEINTTAVREHVAEAKSYIELKMNTGHHKQIPIQVYFYNFTIIKKIPFLNPQKKNHFFNSVVFALTGTSIPRNFFVGVAPPPKQPRHPPKRDL